MKNHEPPRTTRGNAHPLGASIREDGVNFSLYSENADAVDLLLFDHHADTEPSLVIPLDPVRNRTFHFWHVFVKGVQAGAIYNFRVHGPFEPSQGLRFNPRKVLLDPYARAVTTTTYRRADAVGETDNMATALRSVVVDTTKYDWEGDAPLNHPLKDTIIYEMHVGGFTRDPSSGATHPGTFQAVTEKIPYLKRLGITAVELLPVFFFDDLTPISCSPSGELRFNYWGYSTLSFFSPHHAYCLDAREGRHADEFRDMVKAIHAAGIEVILDVVFNHTDEGNDQGPYFNFKGIDNSVYYYLVQGNSQYYFDYSGCGNTVKANHPTVAKFIVDCLRFWVDEMHVDGFRFDEGSILTRDEEGCPMRHPPVLWSMELEQVFDRTKLIAEAWDAAGLYQIGSFPGYRWCEWNGKFRDTLRRYLKGDPGLIGEVASRISGNADLYQHSRHAPTNSINFVCCHDGFTLWDLVSYNQKHNQANGENNRDGIDDNLSWNSGAEGVSESAEVNRFRRQRIKNFAVLLMISPGVPMLLSGDEVGKSQGGNNNVYGQNNETAWFDWRLVEENHELLRFWEHCISLRKSHAALRRDTFFTGQVNARGIRDIAWHGPDGGEPDWGDGAARSFGVSFGAFAEGEPDLLVLMNMHYEAVDFTLPYAGQKSWRASLSTAEAYPDDCKPGEKQTTIVADTVSLKPYSILVLLS